MTNPDTIWPDDITETRHAFPGGSGASNAPRDVPWFRPPIPHWQTSAVVIGAGIAGLCAARALQSRGFTVTVLEAGETPFPEASGNPAAIVEPQVAISGVGRAFHEAAFLHARRLYRDLGVYEACGSHHLAPDDKSRARFAKIVKHDLRPEPLFEAADDGGLLVPDAGMVQPPVLGSLLARGVDLRFGSRVTGLEQGTGKRWHITLSGGKTVDTGTVIVAAGVGSAVFPQAAFLPLKARHGQ
ncbi:MAG: FAD-dependent oxidoreductase, partial [Sphingomonadales bacterium]